MIWNIWHEEKGSSYDKRKYGKNKINLEAKISVAN